MKVLLVDDDQGTRLTLGFVLSRAGFEVQTASDGVEAIRLLSESPYDWLVTDGDMVPMNGFDLAVQATKLRTQIKIVMISGVFDKTHTNGYPISHLFTKPVDAQTLLAYLKTH
ncbi:MAG: response regulator [Elusimicrobia bacterium]|nr:response regulator [Elusimicrobiota bacterium]